MNKRIAIIGGGPGGYVAAIKAARLGAKVTLIEKEDLGGTCLNRGCIPTKTLYKNAEIINTLNKIDDYGINIDGYTIDMTAIQKRKNKVIETLRGGVEKLLKANGVEVIQGMASFKNKNTLIISCDDGESEFEADSIIIATGAYPLIPDIEGMDIDGVMTSREILDIDKVPESLIVLGGGVVGFEFASIFSSLGTKVTVLKRSKTSFYGVDSDITKRFPGFARKKGINIVTGIKLNKLEKSDNMIKVHTEDKAFEAQNVLISLGTKPNLDGLNLDSIGIEYDSKGIKVNENYMTNIEGIYAIGDINAISMLAHAASVQGEVVAEKIMSHEEYHNDKLIPCCIFVFPEIAFVGLTEDEAKEKNIPYKTSKFMFGANGKALSMGEGEGFVKIITSEDGTMLGVHIMGPHASDLIHEGVLAIGAKLKAEDVMGVVHAHPTLSEAFAEAVMGIEGKAIHMAPNSR